MTWSDLYFCVVILSGVALIALSAVWVIDAWCDYYSWEERRQRAEAERARRQIEAPRFERDPSPRSSRRV